MSKTREFYDYQQAEMYLMESVIRFKDEPVVVAAMDYNSNRDIFCWFKKLTRREHDNAKISIYDVKINMNPVPLGYINWKRFGEQHVLVAHRDPIRMWKIGLTKKNLIIRGIDHRGIDTVVDETAQVINSKALRDTITGKFPSLKKCIKDGIPQAFSRRFAIRGDSLYFSQLSYPIGYINNGELALLDDYAFLSEVLGQDVGI